MNNPRVVETKELEVELYQGTLDERLAALAQLCAQLGPKPRRGTNCHIHTSESFSVFRSPTEAVWQAAREGVAVLGINDHYTVAGHEEFRRACAVAGIAAVFSLEAVAMDREAEEAGLRLNDPDNPGRIYLCGKGVTRTPSPSSPEMQSLARMRAALERRNREITGKVAALFRERLGASGPSWENVVALTPRGNATERHVAYAVLLRLRELAGELGKPLAELIVACCGAAPRRPATTQVCRFSCAPSSLKRALLVTCRKTRTLLCRWRTCAGFSWPTGRFRPTPFWETRFCPAKRIWRSFSTGSNGWASTRWRSFPTATPASAWRRLFSRRGGAGGPFSMERNITPLRLGLYWILSPL